MIILTKEERASLRYRCEDATCDWWDIRAAARDRISCPYKELLRALDTIDALEAERDTAVTCLKTSQETIGEIERMLEAPLGEALDYEFALEDGVAELIARLECSRETVERLAAIRAYALEHSTTKVIGGAHAVLRKIAEMAGGGE